MSILPAFIGFFSAVFAVAPLTAADEPKFEAASVRRTERCTMETTVDPSRIALIGVPLKVVLREAYGVKLDQVVGPGWLDVDCYEVVAKIPEGVGKDQLPAMLRGLLVERFKLVAHKESRTRPGYTLTVDKGGPKFQQSTTPSGLGGANGGSVRFGAGPQASAIKGSMTMSSLARFLTARLGAPVEDATGLSGKYDIDITWTPDPTEKGGAFTQNGARTAGSGDTEPSPTTGLGSIFTAVRETLGLKLEPRKEQVEVIVVDHIDRAAVEN